MSRFWSVLLTQLLRRLRRAHGLSWPPRWKRWPWLLFISQKVTFGIFSKIFDESFLIHQNSQGNSWNGTWAKTEEASDRFSNDRQLTRFQCSVALVRISMFLYVLICSYQNHFKRIRNFLRGLPQTTFESWSTGGAQPSPEAVDKVAWLTELKQRAA